MSNKNDELSTMSNKQWRMVGFRDHMPRVVAAHADEYFQAYRGSARRRWGDPGSILTEVDEIIIDRGGPMLADRTLQTVDLEGLRLSVPTTELLGFMTQLMTAREVDGFVEVRGDVHVIVLTPDQRHELLAAWNLLEPACRAQAIVETMRYEAAVTAINEHPGIQFSVPKHIVTPKTVH